MKNSSFNKKSFSIYCSGGASRVIKFYSISKNLNLYRPTKVIFDGKSEIVRKKLYSFFKEDLILKNTSNSDISSLILDTLKQSNSDYLLCFGNEILKPFLVNAYKDKIINFHPSLLPSFKGLNAIDKAIQFGVSLLGNTAHFIDNKIDNGEIIIQSSMLREDFQDYEDVLELQFPMLKIILRDILNYEINNQEITKELKDRKIKYLIPTKI